MERFQNEAREVKDCDLNEVFLVPANVISFHWTKQLQICQ